MYCGSNKTALLSQQVTSQALMRLIRVKPYASITVSELCREAGISRQTFYTLFTSRENVVVFALRQTDDEAPSPSPCHGANPLRAMSRLYSQYIVSHAELLKLLVDNHIDYLLQDSLYAALAECGCFLAGAEPCLRRYAASYYAGGIACLARRYAQEGCAASQPELEDLLARLFAGTFFDPPSD